jgi:hypothetical protein
MTITRNPLPDADAEEQKRERFRAILDLAAENKPHEIYVLLSEDGR